MHTHDLSAWQHDHHFGADTSSAERSTRLVMWITAAMMMVEIGAGWWFNSMALLADGWHMSSHALAIGLSAFAYAAARRYARDPRFAFGTWKIEVLGGFASALVLLGIAALMVVGSLVVVAASVGFRRSLWLVAAGLAAHGVMDFFHGQLVVNPGVPAWWPAFCGSYDVAAAGYLAWRLTRGPTPRAPVAAASGRV